MPVFCYPVHCKTSCLTCIGPSRIVPMSSDRLRGSRFTFALLFFCQSSRLTGLFAGSGFPFRQALARMFMTSALSFSAPLWNSTRLARLFMQPLSRLHAGLQAYIVRLSVRLLPLLLSIRFLFACRICPSCKTPVSSVPEERSAPSDSTMTIMHQTACGK